MTTLDDSKNAWFWLDGLRNDSEDADRYLRHLKDYLEVEDLNEIRRMADELSSFLTEACWLLEPKLWEDE